MKKVLLLLLAAALSFSAFAQETQTETVPQDTTISASDLANLIIKEAESHLGKPYKYGGRGPKYFDCSGFTSFVYAKFGFTLGRSSSAQANDGVEVSGTLSDLQKGDLVIFSGKKKGVVGHVAIFMDYDEETATARFIHADKAGVRISYFTEPYYQVRVMGARRLIPDFIGRNNRRVGAYPFNTANETVMVPDTLTLGDGDKRVVIFERGRWALVDSEGKVTVPGDLSAARIILYPNGTWKSVAQSTVVVPTMSVRPPAEQDLPADASADAASTPAATPAGAAATTNAAATTQPAQQTAAGTSTQPEKVYHTIVKGDTLYELSLRYKVPVSQICRLNNITENTILNLGRKLRIK